MSQDDKGEKQERRDFFISYTGRDKPWAEWIAAQLDAASYTFFFQPWDFRPGSNFVVEMDQATKLADCTLLVLSAAYQESGFARSEWAAAFRQDPTGSKRRLLPVHIEACVLDGLLAQISYIDLVGYAAEQAKERLLMGIQAGRVRPVHIPFPGQQRASVAFPGAFPTVWNIPIARNPFFTGREDLLEQLHMHLHTTQATAISQSQAISGLGGIGKTQIAVEYAYRYRSEYQYVLWAQANSIEALNSSYSEIANLLGLPEKDEQKQDKVVQAVKRWLQRQHGWLLILDNADDPSLLPPFLPPPVGGHLLLTTRTADVSADLAGLAHPLVVGPFSDKRGVLFLLRRANLLPLDAILDQEAWHLAMDITHELGGLPLALDQAGAYINATKCSLSVYQQIYQQHRAQLLAQRRGADHPEPVATTWNISFRNVEQQCPAAAELLCLCAFLAPDAIPETIFTEGAEEFGPVLAPVFTDAYQFNEIIETLQAYSLITRDPHAQTLTIHRLVQAVLRDSMTSEVQTQWILHDVCAILAVCPEPDFPYWSTLERMLPHMLACATWVWSVQDASIAAAHLLNRAGVYLYHRARYKEAEPLYQSALEIWKQQLGPEHPNTAASLNNLAGLYYIQGKYNEAEPLLAQALAIREQQPGEHGDVVASLNNLAELYRVQGKYTEAEPLYQRALAIAEQVLGSKDPVVMAACLNNLGLLYYMQGKYNEAEPLLAQALAIRERQLGAEHPDTALCLNNLAELYQQQGKYNEAEPLFVQALATRERQLGAEHPNTASTVNNLGLLYLMQKKYAQAEPLLARALVIAEQQLGASHPHTASSLNNLANLYENWGKRYSQAEALYQQALAIAERLGDKHPTAQAIRANYRKFVIKRKII